MTDPLSKPKKQSSKAKPRPSVTSQSPAIPCYDLTMEATNLRAIRRYFPDTLEVVTKAPMASVYEYTDPVWDKQPVVEGPLFITIQQPRGTQLRCFRLVILSQKRLDPFYIDLDDPTIFRWHPYAKENDQGLVVYDELVEDKTLTWGIYVNDNFFACCSEAIYHLVVSFANAAQSSIVEGAVHGHIEAPVSTDKIIPLQPSYLSYQQQGSNPLAPGSQLTAQIPPLPQIVQPQAYWEITSQPPSFQSYIEPMMAQAHGLPQPPTHPVPQAQQSTPYHPVVHQPLQQGYAVPTQLLPSQQGPLHHFHHAQSIHYQPLPLHFPQQQPLFVSQIPLQHFQAPQDPEQKLLAQQVPPQQSLAPQIPLQQSFAPGYSAPQQPWLHLLSQPHEQPQSNPPTLSMPVQAAPSMPVQAVPPKPEGPLFPSNPDTDFFRSSPALLRNTSNPDAQ